METFSPTVRYVVGWTSYLAMLLLRIGVTIRVQPGYLHPDEFFQSVEVAAGDIYHLQVLRSWEFVPRDGGPLRSIAGMCPVVYFPIWFYRRLVDGRGDNYSSACTTCNGEDFVWRVLFPPRLTAAIGSIIVDLFILYASAYQQKPSGNNLFLSPPPVALILYASSTFGGLLWAGRTIANAWETMSVALFGILFLAVMRHSLHTQTHSLTSITVVGSILCIQTVLSVWAVFLRFTYLFFVFPMALVEIFALFRMFRWMMVLPCTLCVLVISLVLRACLLVDSAYFLELTPQSAVSLALTDMVCVPCRFLTYNTNTNHLATHGLHPRFLHVLVNFPLIFGPVIGFLGLWVPSSFLSFHCVWWFCCTVPLFLLSCIPHQEARFLMPIVPLVLILAGHRLEGCFNSSRKRSLRALLVLCWFLQQFVLFFIFGSLHQGGLVSFYKSLAPWTANSSTCHNYVFYHTYMPPRFPFGQPLGSISQRHCNSIVDLSGSEIVALKQTLQEHFDYVRSGQGADMIMNLIYPGSLDPLPLNFSQYGMVRSHKSFFGHLSFEDPPQLGHAFSHATILTDFGYWYSQLSLHVLSIAMRA